MLAACLAVTSLGLSPIPYGKSLTTMTLDGTPLDVYAYKPLSYRRDRIIVVMHGVLRNADEYRDHSVEMAERFGALVLVPRFDAERFPSRLYQRGGVTRADGTAAPEGEWTYRFIPKMVDEVRQRDGRKTPFWVIGHSAGGQFVVRMSAFTNIGAERLIAANAGSHVFPRTDWAFGYGFGSLPASLSDDSRLKNYLAAPLTFYQGTGDDKPDANFDASAAAMLQGPGRLQRGRACFEFGRKLAKERGWRFNWKIVEAKGIVHDHEAMFNHSQCALALFGAEWKECDGAGF